MKLATLWTRLVWAGAMATSVTVTTGLTVKQEPGTDTQLYVAPATRTRKQGRALPSTIIISRPLGVRGDSLQKDHHDDDDDDEVSAASLEDVSTEGDGSGLDLQSNIKFYKLECSSGRTCTSIIPARTTTRPPASAPPFTHAQIKQFLSRFSLRDGFPYSEDFETSGTPPEPLEESEGRSPAGSSSHERHTPRSFDFGGHDTLNYWPGSEYRPRPQPLKGLVFKHKQYEPPRGTPSHDPPGSRPTRRPPVSWDRFSESFPSRRPAMEWQKVPSLGSGMKNSLRLPSRPSRPYRPHQQVFRPHDSSDRIDNIVFPHYVPPSRRPSPPPRATARPPPYDGIWNRYGTSTVSQLDRDTGEWVQVSSSSTQLDQGVFEKPKVPPGAVPSSTHHAVAALTVLGLGDRTRKVSSFEDSMAKATHVLEVPSALPGRPPALIETDGGSQAGAAWPAENLSVSSPRKTSSSFSAEPHVASSGLGQVSVPFFLISTKSLTSETPSSTTTTTPSTTTTPTPTTTPTTTTTSTTTRPPQTPPPAITRVATTRPAANTPTTTTTTPTTTTTTTTQTPQPADEGSFFDNPYAVMAAVGAGLIPATFAALLPAFVGRRRRRRRRSVGDVSPPEATSQVEELTLRVRRAVRSLEGGQT